MKKKLASLSVDEVSLHYLQRMYVIGVQIPYEIFLNDEYSKREGAH